MYNLLYYSKNFRKTTGSLWNYYLDIPNSDYDGGVLRNRIPANKLCNNYLFSRHFLVTNKRY